MYEDLVNEINRIFSIYESRTKDIAMSLSLARCAEFKQETDLLKETILKCLADRFHR